MIVLGIDVAARVDRTAAAFLDGWTLAEIALLRPPVKYPEVLAFCGSAADRADVTLLDATGVGAAVLDMLLLDRPELIGVRFTAGDEIKACGPDMDGGKGRARADPPGRALDGKGPTRPPARTTGDAPRGDGGVPARPGKAAGIVEIRGRSRRS